MEENMGKAKNRKLADVVRQERDKRAWPQGQLADVAGKSLRTIQRLEKDGIAAHDTLMAVASAFQMDVKNLVAQSSEGTDGPAQKKVYLLARLTSAKDISDVITGAEHFQFSHDQVNDKRVAGAMSSLITELKRDVVRWHDADPGQKIQIAFEVSQEIKGIETFGFYLFGIRRKVPKIVGKKRSLVEMSTIYLSHASSPKIAKNNQSTMYVPAVLPEVVQ